MTHRTINRTIAAVLFLAAVILYLRTMAPTLSFWDCGESIATAYTLGIPHPPGSTAFSVDRAPVFDDSIFFRYRCTG
jgi:hypothetical protein